MNALIKLTKSPFNFLYSSSKFKFKFFKMFLEFFIQSIIYYILVQVFAFKGIIVKK